MNKINSEIDKSLYSEKSLYLLNIRELRDLGRKFGVPSPTTMKKKDLVDYILKVVYGEIKTPVRNSFGRPSSREFDINKVVSKIKKNSEISSELKSVSLEDFGTMKVASFRERVELEDIETRVYCEENGKCLLKVREFVDSELDIELSREQANKLRLEHFDVVEIYASDNKMFKIISINGIKVKNNFDRLVVDGTVLRSGVNQDFYFSTKEEIIDAVENLAAECERSNIKLFVFGENEYTEGSTECVIYSENESYSRIYKKLMSFMGLCEKAVLDGLDFVICFEDFEVVESMLSFFEKDVSERIKKYLSDALPKFSRLGNILLMFRCEIEVAY